MGDCQRCNIICVKLAGIGTGIRLTDIHYDQIRPNKTYPKIQNEIVLVKGRKFEILLKI